MVKEMKKREKRSGLNETKESRRNETKGKEKGRQGNICEKRKRAVWQENARKGRR